MGKLPSFEGLDVIRSAVKITKAGDGLSEALRLEPIPLHHDDDVYFILRGKVTQINHVPTGPADETLVRVHTIVTQEITMVDGDLAEPVLKDASATLEAKKRAEEGQDPIEGAEPGAPGLPTAGLLVDAHKRGEHDEEYVEGCADCAWEKEQEDDGEGEPDGEG